MRTEGPVAVDGALNEPAWARAAWSDTFVDIEGDAKPRPTWPTRVKMLWDDAFLYIGAELVEPHIWATQTTHDSVIFTRTTEVFLDPDGDNRDTRVRCPRHAWIALAKPYRDGGKAVDGWEIPC